jgi:ankyrin repeat protein
MNPKLQQALDKIAAADLPSFMDCAIEGVHTRASCGDQPLHIAALWGDADLIATLLEAGADINAAGEDGFTPLHYAIHHNKIEAAKFLIARGADLHKKDSTFRQSAIDFIAASDDPCIQALVL